MLTARRRLWFDGDINGQFAGGPFWWPVYGSAPPAKRFDADFVA